MSNVIQLSCLGSYGRLGNQLFQYAFARTYAAYTNSTLQTPKWVGQELFDLWDPPLEKPCRKVKEDDLEWGETNVDLFGYFQSSRCTSFLSRTNLRQWYSLKPQYFQCQPERQLVVHIRRGDYVSSYSSIYCEVAEEAYDLAIVEWNEGRGLVDAYVTTDTGHRPCTFSQFPFLDDFVSLLRARVLFRANSTFSWWAATLSDGKVYSPVIDGRIGRCTDIHFIPGNTAKCVSLPGCGDLEIGL